MERRPAVGVVSEYPPEVDGGTQWMESRTVHTIVFVNKTSRAPITKQTA